MRKCEIAIGECFSPATNQCRNCNKWYCESHIFLYSSHNHAKEEFKLTTLTDQEFWESVFLAKIPHQSVDHAVDVATKAVEERNKRFPPKSEN